jgi:hypothetical protein
MTLVASSSAPDDVLFVTGLDSGFFGTAIAMIGSFESLCPGRSVLVCDFGLNGSHRGFFAERGTLLAMPEHVAQLAEPLAKKTQLASYLGDRPYRAVVWIDADMMLVHPVVDRVIHLVEQMESQQIAIAICEDAVVTPDIEAFFSIFGAAHDLSDFRLLLERSHTDPRRPYVNTGVFICRDATLLSEWCALGQVIPYFFLFDQNVIHAPMYQRTRRHLLLQPAEWNAHGRWLGVADPMRTAPPLRLVHSAGSFFSTLKTTRYARGGRRWRSTARLFDDLDLRARQLRCIEEFIERHATLLERHGVLA